MPGRILVVVFVLSRWKQLMQDCRTLEIFSLRPIKVLHFSPEKILEQRGSNCSKRRAYFRIYHNSLIFPDYGADLGSCDESCEDSVLSIPAGITFTKARNSYLQVMQ